MVIAPARRTGDPGSNSGPGDNFSLELLIIYYFAFPDIPFIFILLNYELFWNPLYILLSTTGFYVVTNPMLVG